MPVIVCCPSCGGKLRVSEELRGQPVRCPTCDHTFDSTTAGAVPVEPPRPAPLDRPLNLSLDDDGSPPPPAAPPRPTWREEESPPPLRPRLRDDWEARDIRRVPPRRDAEPDRGPVVLSLGILSLACLAISCTPIGAVLGLIAWVMGQVDLRKMKRGEMDPNGQGMTTAGWICGIIGTLLNGLITLGCLTLFGFMWYQDVNRPMNTPPPATKKMVAPPPAPPPGNPPGKN